MEIGIIGKGKMGRDILDYLLQYDHRLTLVLRRQEDVAPLRASIEKQLKKLLRRGYIDESGYEEKREKLQVSAAYEDLKHCDLVIESVWEDKDLKQELFRRLEAIVKPQCVLATNTSSIPLTVVFQQVKTKNRCIGLHFFYPVKVIQTVEINKLEETEDFYVDLVKELLLGVNKAPLVLEPEANMVLTRMFTTVITQAYRIYQEGHLAIEEIDSLLKDSLLTFGLFEIIDSTGINIILRSIENFTEDRYHGLYRPLYEKGLALLQGGYSGGTGNKGLVAYEREHTPVLKTIVDPGRYKADLVLRLKALIVNELAYLTRRHQIEAAALNNAVQEVFGLIKSPMDMAEELDQEQIKSTLLTSHRQLGEEVYFPEDLSRLKGLALSQNSTF